MRFETRAMMELAVSFLTKVQQLNQTIFEENTAWSPELARSIQQLWASKVLKNLYYKHDNKIFEVNDSAGIRKLYRKENIARGLNFLI
jgi:hypothetical protein